MSERVGDVARGAGDVPPRRDAYADGVIATPQELYDRIYPSSDVLGVSSQMFAADSDQDDIGGGYGVADENSNPNTVPGLVGGRDVDPDDL
jgi:hypothetical protein